MTEDKRRITSDDLRVNTLFDDWLDGKVTSEAFNWFCSKWSRTATI